MIQIVLHRNLSLIIACSDGMRWVQGDATQGWQDKAPTFVWGMWLVGLRVLGTGAGVAAGAYLAKFNEFNTSSAIGHRFAGVDRYDPAGRRDKCSARSHPAWKPDHQTSKELRRPSHAGCQEGRTYRQGVWARQEYG
jgi:hypothetical protein